MLSSHLFFYCPLLILPSIFPGIGIFPNELPLCIWWPKYFKIHILKIKTHLPREKVKWSEISQSCPTLCNPMDCNLPGSSVHGIFQARILEWVAQGEKGTLNKMTIIYLRYELSMVDFFILLGFSSRWTPQMCNRKWNKKFQKEIKILKLAEDWNSTSGDAAVSSTQQVFSASGKSRQACKKQASEI